MKPPTEEQLERVLTMLELVLPPGKHDGGPYIWPEEDRVALKTIYAHREALEASEWALKGEYEALVSEVARLTEERDRLRSALINLKNQVVGALEIGRAGIVQEVGATNVACIEAGIRDAEDALAALHPEQPEHKCHYPLSDRPRPGVIHAGQSWFCEKHGKQQPPTDTGKE